jgi:hypothetical protein
MFHIACLLFVTCISYVSLLFTLRCSLKEIENHVLVSCLLASMQQRLYYLTGIDQTRIRGSVL